jgi:hypothetical protein
MSEPELDGTSEDDCDPKPINMSARVSFADSAPPLQCRASTTAPCPRPLLVSLESFCLSLTQLVFESIPLFLGQNVK